MGAGIAQVGLQGGLEVVGREVTAELGERAGERIGHFLTRAVEKGRLEQTAREAAMARLSLTTDLADLAACDLVIEAVFEDLDVKRELFAALDEVVEPDAVLATNPSARSLTEIAAATAHPDRRVVFRVVNPAP